MFTHLSAYHFTPLDDLPARQTRLRAVAEEGNLKGTILLSPEGINLFIAGTPPALAALLAVVRAIPGLAELATKESPASTQPYGHLRVKIKREIISFGVPGIDPCHRPSPKLPARTLRQWLDEGRPVTLLDTRNDYEIRLGTFRGAVQLGIRTFREFPAAARQLPAAWKEQPIVMFCTGGIRCEKAGPFLERAGFAHVHQLDGGILKYFEECGGAHFAGACYVFDERVGVDPTLREIQAAGNASDAAP